MFHSGSECQCDQDSGLLYTGITAIVVGRGLLAGVYGSSGNGSHFLGSPEGHSITFATSNSGMDEPESHCFCWPHWFLSVFGPCIFLASLLLRAWSCLLKDFV